MNTGFFYVTNHGLTNDQINRQYAIADAFFELPLEEKMRYLSNTAAGDFRGYKPRATGELSSRDNDERYNIPKFTKEHERAHPQLIKDYYEEIKEFSLVSVYFFALFVAGIQADMDYSVKAHPQQSSPTLTTPFCLRTRSRLRNFSSTPPIRGKWTRVLAIHEISSKISRGRCQSR